MITAIVSLKVADPGARQILEYMGKAEAGMAHVAMHRDEHRVGDVAIGVILLATLFAAKWTETLWPSRARPTWLGGALMGLSLSGLATTALTYGAWHSLRYGYIRCFAPRSRHRWSRGGHSSTCGEDFWDVRMEFHRAGENLISLYGEPVAYWMFYSLLTALLVFALSWLIVCLKAMRSENRRVANTAELAHYRRKRRSDGDPDAE
jgi:hypothetical protein